jgi:hypothetical protein
MTMIRAHFDGKAFVPDEPVDMPVNQAVTVHLDVSSTPEPISVERFEELLKQMDSDTVDGPQTVDWSRDSIYSGTLDDPR